MKRLAAALAFSAVLLLWAGGAAAQDAPTTSTTPTTEPAPTTTSAPPGGWQRGPDPGAMMPDESYGAPHPASHYDYLWDQGEIALGIPDPLRVIMGFWGTVLYTAGAMAVSIGLWAIGWVFSFGLVNPLVGVLNQISEAAQVLTDNLSLTLVVIVLVALTLLAALVTGRLVGSVLDAALTFPILALVAFSIVYLPQLYVAAVDLTAQASTLVLRTVTANNPSEVDSKDSNSPDAAVAALQAALADVLTVRTWYATNWGANPDTMLPVCHAAAEEAAAGGPWLTDNTPRAVMLAAGTGVDAKALNRDEKSTTEKLVNRIVGTGTILEATGGAGAPCKAFFDYDAQHPYFRVPGIFLITLAKLAVMLLVLRVAKDIVVSQIELALRFGMWPIIGTIGAAPQHRRMLVEWVYSVAVAFLAVVTGCFLLSVVLLMFRGLLAMPDVPSFVRYFLVLAVAVLGNAFKRPLTRRMRASAAVAVAAGGRVVQPGLGHSALSAGARAGQGAAFAGGALVGVAGARAAMGESIGDVSRATNQARVTGQRAQSVASAVGGTTGRVVRAGQITTGRILNAGARDATAQEGATRGGWQPVDVPSIPAEVAETVRERGDTIRAGHREATVVAAGGGANPIYYESKAQRNAQVRTQEDYQRWAAPTDRRLDRVHAQFDQPLSDELIDPALPPERRARIVQRSYDHYALGEMAERGLLAASEGGAAHDLDGLTARRLETFDPASVEDRRWLREQWSADHLAYRDGPRAAPVRLAPDEHPSDVLRRAVAQADADRRRVPVPA